MLSTVHSKKGLQLFLGLIMGIVFGFLLQKGGVTNYDVILGQLLLTDFTVIKIMLSAVITGMLGVHFLRSIGLTQLHPKPGSIGASVIGGLIFGVGFGTLGYCPGTVAGAVGQGYLDALFGGVVGTLIGAGIFAELFPRLEASVLHKGDFGELTLPQLLRVNPWVVVVAVVIAVVALLLIFEKVGL
jgi:hypothetical protein